MNVSLFQNYKVKLVVFVFAVFIWFFVVTENEYENVIEVPINVLNIPEGKVLLNEIPQIAKVKVRGSGKDLIALGLSRNARLNLDLSISNAKTFVIDPQDIVMTRPAGVLLTQEIVQPGSITVKLDDLLIKKVPIRSKLTIVPTPGYTAVGSLLLSPDSVFVSGPKSVVRKITEIFTEEKTFTDLTFDLNEKIELQLMDLEKVDLSTRQITAFQNIQRLLEIEKTGVPVTVKNAPQYLNIYVVPSSLSLVLQGGGELLTKVEREDIVAYLDYQRIRNSPAKEYPPVIECPPGISYRDVNPQTFRLVFERASNRR